MTGNTRSRRTNRVGSRQPGIIMPRLTTMSVSVVTTRCPSISEVCTHRQALSHPSLTILIAITRLQTLPPGRSGDVPQAEPSDAQLHCQKCHLHLQRSHGTPRRREITNGGPCTRNILRWGPPAFRRDFPSVTSGMEA